MTLWPRTQLRRVFRVVNGGTPTADAENWDGPVAWATPIDLAKVNGGRLTRTARTLSTTGLMTGSRAVPAGSLIVSTRAPIGYVAEATVPMAFNQGCRGLMPWAEIDSRYFRYQLLALASRLNAAGQGSTFVELSGDALASVEVVVPPIHEQHAIADFLDTETARIDALITKKRRLVKLLESRLRSAASEIVEGGGGPLITGIPSIPRVPSTWRVLRNKVFMREVNEPSPDGLGEMLSVSHLTGVTPRSEKTVYMFEAESTVGYKVVRPGDLVINTMWAWMGAAGVSRHEGIVSPAYGVYRLDGMVVDPDYYDLLIRTPAYITEMTRFSRGVTSSRLRLYPDEFLRLSSPLPPLDAQGELAEGFKAATARSRELAARVDHQINLLVEHRRALITAAVAGELPVGEAA